MQVCCTGQCYVRLAGRGGREGAMMLQVTGGWLEVGWSGGGVGVGVGKGVCYAHGTEARPQTQHKPHPLSCTQMAHTPSDGRQVGRQAGEGGRQAGRKAGR